MESYLTIKKVLEKKINIKKSIFIGNIFFVKDRGEINENLEKVRKRHINANHVAYGAIILKGDRREEYFSDDGEPHNSAGMPILREIKRENLANILITVTRYFGGKKLGIRGLIDAYSGCARMLIEESHPEEVIIHSQFEIPFKYENFGIISYEIKRHNGVILDRDYLKMNLLIKIPVKYEQSFLRKIREKIPDLNPIKIAE